MPTELDDRITRALGRLADSVDVAEPVEVPNIEWSAPTETVRRGALVGWLAVAAAVVLVLVMVGVWRRDAGTGVSDTPVSPTTTVPVPYGEIPPLDDHSIFYLPDPMPEGWHVTTVRLGETALDWEDSGGKLDIEPPLTPGMFRSFSVDLVRDDGEVIVHLSVTETPREHEFGVFGEGTETEIAGRRVAVYDVNGNDAGYAPSWSSKLEVWAWVEDGRSVDATVGGDPVAAQAIVAALRHVDARTVLGAVAEGQVFARSLPVVTETEVANGARLTARGPDGRVLAVCADAHISTCSYVPSVYGHGDVALGWAGTETGGFPYGWVPSSLVPALDPETATFELTDTGAFVTEFAGAGLLIGADGSGEIIGHPPVGLIGMPALAGITVDGSVLAGTRGVSDAPVVEGAGYGEIESIGEMSVFMMPMAELMPKDWYVARVAPVLEAEWDGEPTAFQSPPLPLLPDDRQRSLEVELVKADGSAATLVVTETPRPATESDLADLGQAVEMGRHTVHVVDPWVEGVGGDRSLYPFEAERRGWVWVEAERKLELSGVLTDDDAEALIDVVTRVLGRELVAAVRRGQAFAAQLPLIDEYDGDAVHLTVRGNDSRPLFVCGETGLTVCATGATNWLLPGMTRVIVPDRDGDPVVATWMPAAYGADFETPQGGEVRSSSSGTFIVGAPTTGGAAWDGRGLPDLDPIGMPRIAMYAADGTLVAVPDDVAIRTNSAGIELGDGAVWMVSPGMVTSDSTEVVAEVRRLGCAGGMTGRVLEPKVVVRGDEIVITFEVATPIGRLNTGIVCASNDVKSFVVNLGEPVGDRRLVDGACERRSPVRDPWCADDGVRWP
jgi:hypothetical protein